MGWYFECLKFKIDTALWAMSIIRKEAYFMYASCFYILGFTLPAYKPLLTCSRLLHISGNGHGHAFDIRCRRPHRLLHIRRRVLLQMVNSLSLPARHMHRCPHIHDPDGYIPPSS